VIVASAYQWLLLGHVLAAMLWLGGLVALSVLAWRLHASGDADATLRFAGALGTVGPLVFAPSVVAVVAFGVALLADSDTWDVGQTWVQLALALFAVALVFGAAFQSRAGIGASRAAAAGDATAARGQVRRWAVGNVAVIALLLAITWDMVFKPGL
jgi:uncharacterized membrane protein